MAGAVGALDRFVHPALRRNPDLLYRTHVLAGLLISFAAMCALACVILALMPLPRMNQWLGSSICFTLFAGTCTLLRQLQRHGRYRFCSAAAVLMIDAAVVAGMVLSGGIMQSSVAQLLMLPPLIAYYFGGVRGGNYSALLSLSIVGIFLALERTGVRFPQTVGTERDLRALQLLICFFNVLTVSAIALAYELTTVKLTFERDREHEKALALAQRDVLTGLANRRSLDTCLSERVQACDGVTPPRSFVLCCIDLDQFKPINDRYGHKVGDEVLRVVGERLRLSFRGNDVVGRQGGDEFMAIFDITGCLQDTEGGSVELLAERMLFMIGKPIDTTVGPLRVGASLGFARYPRDGHTAEALKAAADAAMYEAKSAGGTTWRIRASTRPGMAPERPAPSQQAGANAPGADAPASPPAEHGPGKTTGFPRKTRLSALVDSFVHPALRAEPGSMGRSRILAMALLLGCAVLSITAVVVALAPFSPPAKFVGYALCTFIVAGAALLLMLLRRSGNYVACSAGALLLGYFAVLAGISASGGVAASCVAQLMVVSPLIGYFLGGTRLGTSMVIAALATIVVFVVLEMSGFRFYDVLGPLNARMLRPIADIVALAFTSGMAFSYAFVTRTLRRDRNRERRLVERLAHTDALTGLANRLKFDSELSARLARSGPGATPHPFTLCCVDLDGFKPINDRYGHHIGDEVLQVISDRLRACVRDGDLVGRHGGDEFMLLFNSVRDETQVEFVARRLLRAIAPPIQTRAGAVSVRGSLGFAIFPVDGDSDEALKNAADKAMYAAKRHGGGWRSHSVSFGTTQSFPQEWADRSSLGS
ncbi:MAG: diguanylate cyclase [Nevskia sp.]|nr:diguanylate cyclase [Nevskia sp.]